MAKFFWGEIVFVPFSLKREGEQDWGYWPQDRFSMGPFAARDLVVFDGACFLSGNNLDSSSIGSCVSISSSANRLLLLKLSFNLYFFSIIDYLYSVWVSDFAIRSISTFLWRHILSHTLWFPLQNVHFWDRSSRQSFELCFWE